MNLHEYQSKALFADYGIDVPRGQVAFSAEQACAAATALGGDRWVLKAQSHTGGRGKAGGVRVVEGLDSVAAVASELLGMRLVTHQTGPAGLPVSGVLVEEVRPIARELYLSALVDRASARILFIASEQGGMDIEAVAAEQPEAILTCSVDPVVGLQAYQTRDLAFAMNLQGAQVAALGRIMQGLYRLLLDKDLSQVEVNPLIVNEAGQLLALDAKINIDDNALYAHPDLVELRDLSQEDATEAAAREHGLSYVTLDGEIGCMVNGAGLAMATMDMVRLHGGMPANFLDVGGGTTAAKVAEAFKLILADDKVKAVLVNIFGGIVRCDLIAEGVITAVKEVHVAVPVIVRLEGTNAEAGRTMLAESGLAIIAASDLDDAASKAVEAARA
ncbi:ADP-forming succinate--CoA ligase subunit beta [Methylotetracoccus oryzae]|uniref:ADP-forming succinate--CoA ligase subunit beta n=1 Tax=Methylotetracoccus oryzae TaxID=1919059 RepID=UPI00111A2A2D|nr:ADP-forming succinate--CoA ligase subunit beta [Methylotetracoccus oryzae]